MNSILFELGIEELPTTEYNNIYNQIKDYVEAELMNRSIKHDNIEFILAPRRIGFFIHNIQERELDTNIEIKGPPKKIAYDDEGNPTKALLGFINKMKIEDNEIEIKSQNNVEYVFAVKQKKGQHIKDIISKIIKDLIKKLSFKKSMKWGNKQFEFVRPVHWMLLLFNDEIIPLKIFDIESSSYTYSHRLFNKKVKIDNVNFYYQNLQENLVIPVISNRRKKILNDLKQIELEKNIIIDKDKDLIEEISKLTEHPSSVLGTFDEKYLVLPEEIIKTTVKHHQKSFIVKQKENITNLFISFQDGYGREENIIKGYSRVINARLDDAYFYYKLDKTTSIEKRLKELERITYHKDLGTYKDKVDRLKHLTLELAKKLNFQNLEDFEKAALLSKIDIPSKIVYEFPELQGTFGKIYLSDKEIKEEICSSIEEHYYPKEENGELPNNFISTVISIADKIDDILGFFSTGNIPTGSKDPFALRRKATGILRIFIDKELDIDIWNLLENHINKNNFSIDTETIKEFMKSRFETILTKYQIQKEIINSVSLNWNNPIRALLAGKALNELINEDEFKKFIEGFQRVNNITKNHKENQYQGRLFKQQEEKDLFEKYLETKFEFDELIKRLNYKEALEILIKLKPSIDNYFDNVFVMDRDESLKLNKLSFLKNLADMFLKVGDISKIYQ